MDIIVSQDVIEAIKTDAYITVKMTMNTYEAFTAFCEKIIEVSTEAEKSLNLLRKDHEALCSAVLDTFNCDVLQEISEGNVTTRTISIEKPGRLLDAISIASDWFC